MLRAALLSVIVVALSSSTAFAHGGGGFRGPPGPAPPGCSEPWGGPPTPPPEVYGRGPVVGRILGADGAPLTDARVWCEQWQAAATGEEGRFRCAPNRYPATLVVTAADHAPRVVVARMAPAPGADLDLGDLALEPGGTIEGTVDVLDGDRDSLTLRIVPERPRVPESFAIAARVNRWRGVWVSGAGTFSFRGLPEGSYRVVVSRGRGPDVIVGRSLRPGCEPLVARRADVPQELEMPDFESDGSLLLTHAQGRAVYVFDRTTGRILLSRHDEERIDVSAPAAAVLDVVMSDCDGLLPPLEGLGIGQEVALPAAPERLAIAGQVIRPDGSPVVRAGVWVSSAADPGNCLRREVETDAAGRFCVDGVIGRLTVRAFATGLSNDDRPCAVVAGDEHVLVVVDEERVPGSGR